VYFAGALETVLNFTCTAAWSLAVTRGPFGGLPEAIATLTKSRLTDARLHVYFRDAPGASVPRSCLVQLGAIASSTLTSVRRTLPRFVTVIVNVALP